MEALKRVIESYKYILIDMTKNIKNLNDVDNKVIKKAHNFEKYKNVVFMVDMKNIENKEIVEYYQAVKILPEVLIKHTISKLNYLKITMTFKIRTTSI